MAAKLAVFLALISAAACAPAPQTAAAVHAVHAVPVIRTVAQAPTAIHHAHHTVAHAPAPVVVRTAPVQPVVVRTAPVQPVVVRTAPVQPVVAAVKNTYAEPATVVAVRAEEPEVETVNLHPQYRFGYSVSDAVSGDAKAREETRDGDVVHGFYTVADPDGRIRRVEYTADKVNGFQATVTYDGEPGPVAIPFDVPRKAQPVAVAAAVPAPAPAPIAIAHPQPVQVIEVKEAAPAPESEVIEKDAEEEETPVAAAAVPAAATPFQTVRVIPAGATAAHGFHHPGFIRVAPNGQAFATTPFGLRAFPAGQFLNHQPFFRVVPAAAAPAAAHLIHHQY